MRIILSSAAVSLLVVSAAAQVPLELDTISIGGPVSEHDYEESSSEFRSEVMELFVPTDITDSAFQIPGYAHYGSWDTERIFPELKKRAPADSLILAYEPCDHAHPICGKRTSGYGYRRGSFHHGVDIDLETGDLVSSVFAGKVRISHYSRTFGNVVVVRHENGLETLYAHLSRRMVEPGDIVEAGEFIGLGGNTGRSSGSHLHLEVRYLGRSIDPEQILDIKEGELKTDVLHLKRKNGSAGRDHSSNIHRIRRGDTLYGIARKHGTSVNQLCALNGISRNTVLKIGRSLQVR
jgi:murein DD-endopeptidase MepM/ murein hydrolase activator NlpD